MAKKTQKHVTNLKDRALSLWRTFKRFSQKHPMGSFLGFLGTLLILIIIGNFLRTPRNGTPHIATTPKEVRTFTVGVLPRVSASGKIEKSGNVTLVAQTSGIVQKVHILDGARVVRGQRLLSLATTYQGSNIASLSRTIASRNYNYLLDTYAIQKDLIQKNRDLAATGANQTSSLRDIARKSIDETNNLINLNQDILNSLDANLNQLQLANVGGINDATILQTKQAKAGVVGALNGLRTSLRNTQYTSDETKDPASLSNGGKDVTLKQLDLQERALDLNRDIAKLNVQIAQVNESLMFPTAACAGTIERVQVRFGQSVVPGMPLANIRCDTSATNIVALVAGDTARSISRAAPTLVTIDGKVIELFPRSISMEPTNGSLHSVVFSLPDQYTGKLTDGSFVPLSLPLGIALTVSDPAIPLDSVYQTETKAFVFVIQERDGKKFAATKEVTLGNVVGEYINVEGIKKDETIILDRTITQGDEIKN